MGSGPAPRRASAAAVTATALLTAALVGCSSGAPSAATSPGAPASPATAPPAEPPAEPSAEPEPVPPQQLCTRLITHWAGVILDAGEGQDAVGLDYQSMGLSGGQNEILRAVLADARTEQAANGPAAARELTAREAERRCAERYRSGAPTGGPWQ
ncbi:hypothetical protein [Streptomyces sp. AP-93]|uniref:hypothetical protein n=1 Tax=Streptomyces sp. AP-93 TaxID=2929048 RepID=UPI001FAF11A1|nr:hypothetical protein [Streptomyces sp. AP-93]MCJ0872736.1 hypothetical protein [Streptomyces sp. AP-93]